MCGINGIFSKTVIDNHEAIKKMNDRVFHRGPDDEGYFFSPKCHLAMRRLSIIDLKTGHQPIFSEDERYVIIFNGEIYNYQSIRKKLICNGHQFKTNSDTEVIVHLYEEKKEQCLQELNGMFAFAIYDKVNEELFLARDRIGKKPLFYCIDNNMFLFASELKSIEAILNTPLQLCKEAIECYFAFTFIPHPYTIYENIYKLEPATYMIVKKDLSYFQEKYWDLKERILSIPLEENIEINKKKILELLYDSVSLRMISDVDLGVLLSGGVDSSIILCIMSDLSKKPINTFTVANKIKSFDEAQKAKLVSSLFKTNHFEYKIDNDYLCSIIDNVIFNFDEPFADSSALPTYVITNLASKKVKVVLTGDGGDEIFGGYNRYLVYYYYKLYNLLPFFIREKIIAKLVNSIPVKISYWGILNKIKKIVNCKTDNNFELYHQMQRLGFSEEGIKNIIYPIFIKDIPQKISFKKFTSILNRSNLEKALYADITIGLCADMLTKLDMTSMQNSIEARCPFLDFRLIEASFSIPDNQKVYKRKLKIILKEIFSNRFPKNFLYKPKQGFGIPIGEFLKKELNKEFWGLTRDKDITNLRIVNMNYIQTILKKHEAGKDNTFQLWCCFVFLKWLKKNINKIKL